MNELTQQQRDAAGESIMNTQTTQQFPSIWDRSGPRVIVGQTKQSWIVLKRGDSPNNNEFVKNIEAIRLRKPEMRGRWSWKDAVNYGWIELVSKKDPAWHWFFDEQAYEDIRYIERIIPKLCDHLNHMKFSEIKADTLRKVSDLIGYQETPLCAQDDPFQKVVR